MKAIKRKERLESFLDEQGGWIKECRFYPTRQWRFDYAKPQLMLAIEIEGGGYSRGRHSDGKGFERDLEKYLCAQVDGWQVIRISYNMITDITFYAIEHLEYRASLVMRSLED